MPVIAVPGLTPRSPTRVVGPVFVTVEAPKTAKFAAVPRIPAGVVTIASASPNTATPAEPLFAIVFSAPATVPPIRLFCTPSPPFPRSATPCNRFPTAVVPSAPTPMKFP